MKKIFIIYFLIFFCFLNQANSKISSYSRGQEVSGFIQLSNKTKFKSTINDYEYNKQKIEKQKQINLILEKISKSGYESLTKNEKKILFNESKNK